MALLLLLAGTAMPPDPSGGLARVPPMGWMSWQTFRCDVDCKAEPAACINEALYRSTGDALVEGGFAAAGYTGVHIDDCWERRTPPRDAGGRLVANATRFPSGMAALAAHLHGRGLSFGIYSDEGTMTCGRYPGSEGHEAADAATFASWGVDYLKLDGCNNNVSNFASGYLAMGEALRAASRPIVYSCSWPAYLPPDEAKKPYGAMAQAGCNLWRNWNDIQCGWASLSSIIDHWGNYSAPLQAAAAPGHWNDADMLLVGARDAKGGPCLTEAEERTQMSIWAIIASPLIMGNDARSIGPASRATLLNEHVIGVNQDARGMPGLRLSAFGAAVELWARNLTTGIAVALYNKHVASRSQPTLIDFAKLGLDPQATVEVFDLWAGASLGAHKGSFTAAGVAFHDTAMLRLTPHSAALGATGPAGGAGAVPVEGLVEERAQL